LSACEPAPAPAATAGASGSGHGQQPLRRVPRSAPLSRAAAASHGKGRCQWSSVTVCKTVRALPLQPLGCRRPVPVMVTTVWKAHKREIGAKLKNGSAIFHLSRRMHQNNTINRVPCLICSVMLLEAKIPRSGRRQVGAAACTRPTWLLPTKSQYGIIYYFFVLLH